MGKLQDYKNAGLPICPGGGLNEYQYQKHLGGGVSSVKDKTWKHTGKIVGPGGHIRYTGFHECCGSKRSFRHKVSCEYWKKLNSDDLSDLEWIGRCWSMKNKLLSETEPRRFFARVITPCKECGVMVESASNVKRVCFECKMKRNRENYKKQQERKKAKKQLHG